MTDTNFASNFPTGIATAFGDGINGGGIEFDYFGDTGNQEFGRSSDFNSIIVPGGPGINEIEEGEAEIR